VRATARSRSDKGSIPSEGLSDSGTVVAAVCDNVAIPFKKVAAHGDVRERYFTTMISAPRWISRWSELALETFVPARLNRGTMSKQGGYRKTPLPAVFGG